jgi:hypothetical protein
LCAWRSRSSAQKSTRERLLTSRRAFDVYYGAVNAGLKGWTGESSMRCPWSAGRAIGDTDAFPRSISS